jgi:endonuclease/exonuclease/phosphatase family metal-dependent hydrolase
MNSENATVAEVNTALVRILFSGIIGLLSNLTLRLCPFASWRELLMPIVGVVREELHACPIPARRDIRLRLRQSIRLLLILCTSLLPIPGVSQSPSRPSQAALLEVGTPGKLSAFVKTPAEIKVVSYNIRWRGGDDLRTLTQFLKDDPEIGDAVIIGLQEVDRNKKRTGNANTVKQIAEELGKHYAWAAPPSTEAGKEEETGVAILSNYALTDVQRIVLPHEGPSKRRRVAIGATVNIAEMPIRAYSVHSENRIPVNEKIDQMKAVLEDLAQRPKDMPAIILGDLNTWERSAVKKTSQLFLQENFNTPFANGSSTFMQRILLFPIRLKLDWIWLRGLEATSHGINKKIGLSDHWPLWTVVKVRRRR